MSPSTATDSWFVPVVPRPGAAHVVFGFPNVGGGVASLSGLSGAVPARLEVATVNLPGRQARIRERNRTDLPQLVEELADEVLGYGDRPFSLFGYCSGALLAYLVADALRTRGGRGLAHLVVASYPPPHVARPPTNLHEEPSDAFWDRLVGMGGMPTELAGSPEYRPLIEPVIRADFALFSRYTPKSRPPLDVAITAVSGDDDQVTGSDMITGWECVTSAEFTVVYLQAGHWIMEEALPALADVVGRTIQ